MASQKQLEANRRNAQKSAGPKTPEGKAVVSRNGITHGLTSLRAIVLGIENKDEFRELLDRFRSQHNPDGVIEDFLVLQMAVAAWRLRRITRIETGLLAHRLQDLCEDLELEQPEPDPHDTRADQECANETELLGQAFWRSSSDSIATMLRYENTARRAFYKALHEFQAVRSRRLASPDPNTKIYEANPICPGPPPET